MRVANLINAIKKIQIKQTICYWFGNHCQTATAIFTAESGLNPKAKGYNCYYGDKSKSCAPQDRYRAWSVDCGIAQISVKGQECPKELLDLNLNLKKAKEMFSHRSWTPWVVYNLGSYLQFYKDDKKM